MIDMEERENDKGATENGLTTRNGRGTMVPIMDEGERAKRIRKAVEGYLKNNESSKYSEKEYRKHKGKAEKGEGKQGHTRAYQGTFHLRGPLILQPIG